MDTLTQEYKIFFSETKRSVSKKGSDFNGRNKRANILEYLTPLRFIFGGRGKSFILVNRITQ
jgi:hypothetical protein